MLALSYSERNTCSEITAGFECHVFHQLALAYIGSQLLFNKSTQLKIYQFLNENQLALVNAMVTAHKCLRVTASTSNKG